MLSKLFNYLEASRSELKKVTWPTKKETANHTLLVIGVSLGVAVFLGVVDWLLAVVLEGLIRR
jgi:preprotein translocase subunit SecE